MLPFILLEEREEYNMLLEGEGSMKLLTYLILPELKTYSLNHRSLTNFNQGFMFHSYLVDTAKRIQDRYIVS